MDIFYAGSSVQKVIDWIQKHNYNKLFSYVNDQSSIQKWINTYKECPKTQSKLFIDSGAFSAWTKGTTIDVDEYINWLNERKDYIYLFGQVDSIPGNIKTGHTTEQVYEAAQSTWNNFLYMYERVENKEGLLYTVHVGEPLTFLQQALEWRDKNGQALKYIALGGMVGKNKTLKENFISQCYEVIKRSSNPNVKVHAFGMTSLDLLEKYPITSADSTGWLMTAITGSIMTPMGTICLSEQTLKDSNNYAKLSTEAQNDILNYIKKLGFTYEQLRTDLYYRQKANVIYIENWCKQYAYTPPKLRQGRLF